MSSQLYCLILLLPRLERKFILSAAFLFFPEHFMFLLPCQLLLMILLSTLLEGHFTIITDREP